MELESGAYDKKTIGKFNLISDNKNNYDSY